MPDLTSFYFAAKLLGMVGEQGSGRGSPALRREWQNCSAMQGVEVGEESGVGWEGGLQPELSLPLLRGYRARLEMSRS